MNSEGERIDAHFDTRLKWLVEHYESVECSYCHHFEDIKPSIVNLQFQGWKFNLTEMLHHPPILKCAIGICPTCQGVVESMQPLLQLVGEK